MTYGLLHNPSINEAHVVPMDDLIEHIPSDDCPCGPTCEPVERDQGVEMLYAHKAMDGRP